MAFGDGGFARDTFGSSEESFEVFPAAALLAPESSDAACCAAVCWARADGIDITVANVIASTDMDSIARRDAVMAEAMVGVVGISRELSLGLSMFSSAAAR